MAVYTTLEKIQTTIYGEVYKCFDNKRSCPVALKLSRSSKNLTRGENPMEEVTILERLGHRSDSEGRKYIIQLHDTFEAKVNGADFFCAAFEYADGGDLLDKILQLTKNGQHLSFTQIRKYFTMIAKGLEFIHQHNISHLDLSLENILLTKTNEIRICDFGQAQTKRIIYDPNLRRGKPKYMSPEVYGLQKYDGFKADIWSLGIILWGMITGTLIYSKASTSDARFKVLASHGVEGINLLLKQDRVFDVPSSLVDLLSQMLHIDPIKRYSIQDVLAHPWLNLNKQSSS